MERAKALDEAISVVEPKLAVSFYGEAVEQIIKLDEKGIGNKYAAIQRTVEFERELAELTGKDLNLEELAGQIEQLIEDKSPVAAEAQMSLFMRSQRLFGAGNKPAAKTLLMAAQKLDPESRVGQQIPQILENFFKE